MTDIRLLEPVTTFTQTPAQIRSVALSPERLAQAKAAYNTRRVHLDTATCLLQGELTPRAGDLVLARVERLGQHARIELASGRRAFLHAGDEVIVCYGARYAPDQFEAYVPENLGACDLVAAGGLAATCKARHARMKKPTALQPVGLLGDRHGRRLNMENWALPSPSPTTNRPYTVAVVGTAMNAGKTTTAANVVLGLKRDGHRVGTAKITGTGAGGDRWAMLDAGADEVVDFTDAGVPSTFGLSPQRVEAIFTTLTRHLAGSGAEVIVLEVADGLCQAETASLLASRVFGDGVGGVIFAAGDALGASAGVAELQRQGLPVLAVSGILTASPLAVRETECIVELPVVTAQDLHQGTWLPVPVRPDVATTSGHEAADPLVASAAAHRMGVVGLEAASARLL